MNHLPKNLRCYLQDYFCAARTLVGGGPSGPQTPTSANLHRIKFFSDVAHALHNITLPDGDKFFYAQAHQINLAWAGAIEAAMLHPGDASLSSLFPLPTGPADAAA